MASSILNSDDGVVSGTSGLKTSGGDDGILKIQTNGTDAVSVTGSQVCSFANNFGTVANLPAYQCRAWVNFDGTGTVAIRASGNVSSITDNGTGDYTVNFTSAMPDIDYATVAVTASSSGTSLLLNINSDNVVGNRAPTISATRMFTVSRSGGTVTDSPYINIAIFR
jgi:acetylglutamate kinase